jgi:hypothetical protein
MLMPIGDVFAEQLQPLGAGHHLEVPLEARVHLRAVDDRAGGCVISHLLQGHRRADHIAGEFDAAFVVYDPHLVVRRKPAAVAPAEHLRAQLISDRPLLDQEREHRAAMRHSSPSHARCRLKIGRRSLGSVNTYCRCATGASTFCSTHCPYNSTRFWWQLGQK